MSAPTGTGQFGITTRITRVGFFDGWTGAVAIGVILYTALATYLTLAGFPPSPVFNFSLLVSVQPSAAAAAMLAVHAARTTANPVARRIWRLLSAALVVYISGNLIDFYLRVRELTPFPSLADIAYLTFF